MNRAIRRRRSAPSPQLVARTRAKKLAFKPYRWQLSLPAGTPMSARMFESREPMSIRKVLDLAWPILVGMLSYTAMGILDTLMVAGLGTSAVAAAGLATTISFVALSFGHGLLRGVKVVVAQRTGAGDTDAAERLVWQGLWLAVICGIPIAMLAPFAPWFVDQLGASHAIASEAGVYLGLRILGAPFLFGMTALSSWLQGRGDTRSTMIATVLSNALNLVLDLVLLYGFGPIPALGVKGAAIATVIAWVVGLAFLLLRSRSALRATPSRPDLELLRAVWHVGSPMGLQFVLDVASFAFFASLLARVGEVHLAAHVIAIRIISVSFLPGYAVSEAASVLVGQAVGARRPEEALAAWWESTRLALGIMVGWAVVFLLLPGPLVGIFQPEPAVEAIIRNLLVIAAMFQLFDALATVAYGALTGAGDTRFAMVSNTLIAWLVKLPLAILLAVPAGLGAPGAWMALAVEIAAIAFVSVWRIRSGRWLQIDAEPALVAVAAK